MNTFQKVTELIMLATLINEQTEYCTFVDFSGHVNKFYFSLREGKEEYETKLFDSNFYLKELTEERYQEIKSKFIEILETKEIDLTTLKEREVVSYEYYL